MKENLSHVIDSHQHFWVYNEMKDAWITDEMKVIQRSFLPKDLQPVLQENKVGGCVAVQASQSEEETNFLLELAGENDFIKGVVGWVDLKDKNIEERLIYFSKEKKLSGFRHILQGEDVEEYLSNKDFLHGISLLGKYNYTYDILVYHRQLKYVDDFVRRFPNQRFVLDHLAKPDIKGHTISDWEKEITLIAKNENISCKISGMVTEADWENWDEKDFYPYIDVVMRNFGTDRVLFGSDWPVCLLGITYQKWLSVLNTYFTNYSSTEKENFFGKNAMKFYDL
ncbi:amidohydrolase family protein [Arachidicoccus sp.]|uniref:amidohydrolase family protein n=1 Tax=Arachidicoccus sp. TaxID=1872624 RepID=UPI003D2264EA